MEIDGFLCYVLESVASGEGADELVDLADQIERASGELRSARLRAVDL